MAEKRPEQTPANARLIREFVNTAHYHGGVLEDQITTPEAFQAWLASSGLLPAAAMPTSEEHALALDVREAIRDLAEGNSGGDVSKACIDCLNRAATLGRLVVRFGPEGNSRLKAAASGVAGALGYIMAAVFTAMTDGSWTRLKTCRDDECRYMFFDQSKNHSGAWCSMESCGNRAKARAFRSRHAATT